MIDALVLARPYYRPLP
ncbi:MAG: hypothetical protein LCH78_16910 [Proteobacteria bacterium]|uniref:Uncharacterized protein n=1 Tax=Caulobacter vibrioides TaxID=155892 RepID=A0A2S1B7R1_CAUVI|nr:hypothetical protein [Caulobacter vibrioides]AWC68707.1 hypothetical protein CA606_20225 [Caulobacter vibrioides]MCA0358499.1 hypothetical protein [Pseudomonadota bacterium]